MTELPPKGAPDKVHLVPSGAIKGEDGREFALSNAHDVVRQSIKRGSDLVIDYEHQSTDPGLQKNGPVPAAGWITELEARDDGIWGRVSWTETARNMIANREYRYLSPVIRYNALTRKITRLRGASLVHEPNLELTALSREERPMSEPSDLERIAEALDLEADADLDTILAALTRRDDEPDPARYVPIEAVRELMAERHEQTASMSEDRAERMVSEAMNAGHVTPGMRDWAIALCRQDADAFGEFVRHSPAPYAHLGERRTFPARPGGGVSASPELEALCRQLDLSPGDMQD